VGGICSADASDLGQGQRRTRGLGGGEKCPAREPLYRMRNGVSIYMTATYDVFGRLRRGF
jgi:hypothetical protein